MEVQHPPHPPLPSISNLPSLHSPRFTPIAIAPNPSSSINTHFPVPSTLPTLSTIPQTPQRELWTEPEKYDLLWSIILSSGLTVNTIPWHKINLPRNHTQPSAQVVVQDIALGKHHITHPTFTPSNKAGVVMVASRDLQCVNGSFGNGVGSGNFAKRVEPVVRGSSKKRKLEDDGEGGRDRGDCEGKPSGNSSKEVQKEELEEEDKTITTPPKEKYIEPTNYLSSSSSLSPPLSSVSPPSSPASNPEHQPTTTSTTTATKPTTKPTTTKPKPASRRRRSTSPPINLDLSNPRITSYLKSSGYMNEDGTPVKKRRGRPTKDPFGLSVTLKKQLMRMDPNAPPMKKRGRPRKRFLEIDSIGAKGYIGGSRGGDDGSISPGLRLAIEKIGEEMVEELLVQGRSMRDTEDEEDDEDEEYSEGYDGEGDETGDEEEGMGEKEAEEGVVRNEGSLPTRQVEKMAVDNLVEKPKGR
ncbi:hypothetical protein TWF718_002934 [Orbilia javanica]|uniref:Uncharacterized protein n=1 Tax=Orbilia javanica TaxID=47235 RepID=A0AAN8MF96_9PEZI